MGSLGQHHARIYSEIENVDLVGVADARPERAAEIAERLGCAAFSDYRDLAERVEAVSLAVPTQSHAEIGADLLNRGIHVLVEKPIAADMAGADRLLDAEAASGKVLHVGHSERFNPVLRGVRPLVTRPQFFEAHRLGVFVPRSLDVDVVLDLMIHDLDLVLSLVQKPIAEVRAVGVPVLTPRVDIANARLEFEDGCVANLTASRVSKEKIRKFRFFQPHDYISVDFAARSVEMYSLDVSGGAPRIVERQPEIAEGEPLRFEIEAFLAAVRGMDSPLACTGLQGRLCLEVALKVLAGHRV